MSSAAVKVDVTSAQNLAFDGGDRATSSSEQPVRQKSQDVSHQPNKSTDMDSASSETEMNKRFWRKRGQKEKLDKDAPAAASASAAVPSPAVAPDASTTAVPDVAVKSVPANSFTPFK